jgi:hypothetical protein
MCCILQDNCALFFQCCALHSAPTSFFFWDFIAGWKSTRQFPEFTWTWEVFNYLPGRGGMTKFLNCQNFSHSLWCFLLGLIFVLSYKVDMAALRHMTDSDLKALGIPMVSTLHWSVLSVYEFACFIGELLAPHFPNLKSNASLSS